MMQHRIRPSIATTLLLFFAVCNVAIAQVRTSAEWSTRIWTAASEGNWNSVNILLDKVPDGEEESLVSFRKQLDDYRFHRATETEVAISTRDEALVEMNKQIEAGNTVKAIRSAVEAQTLSKNLDDVMFNEDVQAVIATTQREIDSLCKSGNVLTAQTLMFSMRTFYEDTSRRDLYERWSDRLENIILHVSLLRQYAPEHLHGLFVELAEIQGDKPIEKYNSQASDNWVERIDGIEKNMVIRSLDIATSEHVNSITWDSLIEGGLDAVRKLGEIPVISETFEKAGDQVSRDKWLAAIDEEIQAYPEYLKHISGKRVVIQILDRLVNINEEAMELPEGVIFREFGDGAMGKLDRYSSIIWPDESRRFNQQTEGRFVGVGIHIKENNRGEIVVVSPIEGAPAYYGGMQPDDVIIAVNGKSTSGWSLNDAVDRITGPKGTAVIITVRRPTVEEPIDVFLTRDTVKLHSVRGWWKEKLNDNGQPKWDWFIDKANHIGYIKLSAFSEETYTDIRGAIREMLKETQPNGLILDLRYNPGGLLPAARRVANLFVRTGTIVSGETADGEELFRMRALSTRAYLADWPVVILINKGSASASEIVAGCVQAHDAGIIVGQRSWGKGSVQTVHQIAKDANLKLTTQFYRLPSTDNGVTAGRLVDKRRGSTDWGVLPDVEVYMSERQIMKSNELRREADLILIHAKNDRPDINRLLSEGLDPQLETALLILRANAISRMISDYRRAQLN